MIFVITGTEAFPFNRLLIELDRLKETNQLNDEIFIQSGSCTYKPKHCKSDAWLPFNAMCDNINKAEMVIAHAGAGTTLLCLELGKTPIIVTRRKQFNEHLDDHQVPFAKMMEQLDYALVAYDVGEIKDCIGRLSSGGNNSNSYQKDNTDLVNYLNRWFEP